MLKTLYFIEISDPLEHSDDSDRYFTQHTNFELNCKVINTLSEMIAGNGVKTLLIENHECYKPELSRLAGRVLHQSNDYDLFQSASSGNLMMLSPNTPLNNRTLSELPDKSFGSFTMIHTQIDRKKPTLPPPDDHRGGIVLLGRTETKSNRRNIQDITARLLDQGLSVLGAIFYQD